MEEPVNNLAYIAISISFLATIASSASAYFSYKAVSTMKDQLAIQSRLEKYGYIKDIFDYLQKNPIQVTTDDSNNT